MNNRIDLNGDWSLQLINSYDQDNKSLITKNGKLQANVPGTIHTDLLDNQIIEDPFFSNNENKVTWIPNCDWSYSREFIITKQQNKKYNIVFEGIDTVSEIYINSKLVGKTFNMFIQHCFDVTKFLISGKNVIEVILKSPKLYSEHEENKYGKLPVALNSSRVYIRKAQYSFGWDWGPELATSGIWKDVYIEENKNVSITNLTFITKSISKDVALTEIKCNLNGVANNNYNINVRLSHNYDNYEQSYVATNGLNSLNLEISNPKLWFPNGEGPQNLYTLELTILNNSIIVDSLTKSIGIRTVELITENKNKPDFAFKINGKKIFCKGANWIPADSFLPRIKEKKYLKLLELAKNANMNMIRVWGGGIYENDGFYETCDRLGLLVWQDFMFACASYPEHDYFLDSVKEEVKQNIYRLQHHASMAIWCGNNENEWLWFQENEQSLNEMSGHRISSEVIPKILKEIDNSSNYWISSPFGNEKDPNSLNSGNTHQWNMWSFWEDYTEVIKYNSLFVTEFGFQGPANIDTFNKCLPKINRSYQDPIFEFHNKQVEGPERLIKLLSSHLPIKTDWEDFNYLTQLNQGFALKTSIEHWRTNNKTNGSIIWQLNDCWPVTSWSLIDSELKAKIAYYFVKNIFANQFIQISKYNASLNINIFNKSLDSFSGRIEVNSFEACSGQLLHNYNKDIEINPGEHLSKSISDYGNNSITIAKLYNINNILVNSNYYTKRPWKHLQLAKTDISLKIISKDGNKYLVVSCNKPTYFIDLQAKDITFEKRGFCLLPGMEEILTFYGNNVQNLQEDEIKIFCLNNYL